MAKGRPPRGGRGLKLAVAVLHNLPGRVAPRSGGRHMCRDNAKESFVVERFYIKGYELPM
ncbi:MAG: hypothetical protein COX17_07610 [Deltaproteobacteria bacterium CG23_combo_of_CG06-09_8_20_14_all_60_8]|nr:MAG: hypothetical protein COX17_07610 [Deltaproteobacteria bacterium CG23_combo_of_CG06-09_8_20_14_all_60_8]